MNRRSAGLGLVAWMVGLTIVPVAEAHMRDYLVNQPYYTTKQGEFEVELWNDFNLPDTGDDNTYNSKHQVEVEYGVTDHVQLAYYEVYTWDRDHDWQRDEFKVEAKLRLAEAGQWPVDVAFYTEYANPDGSRQARSDEIENRIILSKDFGPWNVVGNFIFEKEINNNSNWEFEYTAGVSYGLSPRTRVGVEVKQALGTSDDFGVRDDRELFLVPGLYTNLTRHVRLLVGPAFGLTRASNDLQLKSLLEVEF